MNRSPHDRLKWLISINQWRRQPDQNTVDLACFFERALAHVRLDGEPNLPNGYRHIRSAIGALMMIGQDPTGSH
jgi:hypothetical protein